MEKLKRLKEKLSIKFNLGLEWFKKQSKVRQAGLCVCGVCLLALLILLGVFLINFIKTQAVLSEYKLKEDIQLGVVVGEIESDTTDYLNIDLSQYTQSNHDTVGYLEVKGANIEYPVVQSGDNNYYLTHDFDMKENAAGWIYADYRCDLEYLGQNTVIYGHNMKNGSMFANLKKLTNEKLQEDVNNRVIRLQTENATFVYEIVSIYTSDIDFYFIEQYFTNDAFIKFIEEIKSRNTMECLKESNVDVGDTLLTLVTCSGTDDRLVVHAKQVSAKYN